jgi:hypothetical protein
MDEMLPHERKGRPMEPTRCPGRGRPRHCRTAACAVLALAMMAPAGAGESTRAATLDASAEGNRDAATAQARIDKLSDDTDALAAEYRAALQETRVLKSYNKQLDSLIASQLREMEELREQIGSVTIVGRQVLPLMLRMVDALGQFVDVDVPFLLDERRERVANLRELMDRADVTISEKYRRLLEAFQIENEYGRTIEAYRDSLDVGDVSRTVDFLRVGRNVLLYQALDGRETGVWDAAARSWTVLPDAYRGAVRQGLRIARRQAAPDLIRIPMPAAPALE